MIKAPSRVHKIQNKILFSMFFLHILYLFMLFSNFVFLYLLLSHHISTLYKIFLSYFHFVFVFCHILKTKIYFTCMLMMTTMIIMPTTKQPTTTQSRLKHAVFVFDIAFSCYCSLFFCYFLFCTVSNVSSSMFHHKTLFTCFINLTKTTELLNILLSAILLENHS